MMREVMRGDERGGEGWREVMRGGERGEERGGEVMRGEARGVERWREGWRERWREREFPSLRGQIKRLRWKVYRVVVDYSLAVLCYSLRALEDLMVSL